VRKSELVNVNKVCLNKYSEIVNYKPYFYNVVIVKLVNVNKVCLNKYSEIVNYKHYFYNVVIVNYVLQYE